MLFFVLEGNILIKAAKAQWQSTSQEVIAQNVDIYFPSGVYEQGISEVRFAISRIITHGKNYS